MYKEGTKDFSCAVLHHFLSIISSWRALYSVEMRMKFIGKVKGHLKYIGTVRKNGRGGRSQPILLFRIDLIFIDSDWKYLKQNFPFP